jgi:Predicted secreted protein containing a PDZ domain
VREYLTNLSAIETRMVDSIERWADAVRDEPEAATAIDRMRTTSKSHRDALEDRLAVTASSARPSASVLPTAPVPTASASEALRQAAEAAVAAAFACEAAYQTARLSADGDTCDLLEPQLSDHAATVLAARRLLPQVVARELRRAGVSCVCRCPMCSIGACGCVRATLAAAEVAWGGEEPTRTSGLILSPPPRPGSQLAEAGLEEGDLVLSVDGDEVGSNREAQAALRRHEVGEEVRINVERRDGARTQVIVQRVG